MQTLRKENLYPIKDIEDKLTDKKLLNYFSNRARQLTIYPHAIQTKLTTLVMRTSVAPQTTKNEVKFVIPKEEPNLPKDISIKKAPNEISAKTEKTNKHKKKRNKENTILRSQAPDKYRTKTKVERRVLSKVEFNLTEPLISKNKQLSTSPSEDKTKSTNLTVSEKTTAQKPTTVGVISDNIIANFVHPSEFYIGNNMLIYNKKYVLITYRARDIKEENLSRMTSRFTIKHDHSAGEYRFKFANEDDLDKFIAESNSIKTPTPFYLVKKDDAIPEPRQKPKFKYPLNGTFDLPWDYVRFYDGYMVLSHPTPTRYGVAHSRKFLHSDVHKNYNDFGSYIEKNCSKLRVKSSDGRITQILNLPIFAKHFPHLLSFSNKNENDYEITLKPLKPGSSVDLQEFNTRNLKKKSPYLAHLADSQVKNTRIHFLVENVVHQSSWENGHEEYGYLFTIHTSTFYHTLVYENKEDESRASLVFKVFASQTARAINWIAEFLSSDVENKREKLARREISFRGTPILDVKRLSHTDLYRWKYELRSLHRLGF